MAASSTSATQNTTVASAASSGSTQTSSVSAEEKLGYILNPRTNRWVKIDGRAHIAMLKAQSEPTVSEQSKASVAEITTAVAQIGLECPDVKKVPANKKAPAEKKTPKTTVRKTLDKLQKALDEVEIENKEIDGALKGIAARLADFSIAHDFSQEEYNRLRDAVAAIAKELKKSEVDEEQLAEYTKALSAVLSL